MTESNYEKLKAESIKLNGDPLKLLKYVLELYAGNRLNSLLRIRTITPEYYLKAIASEHVELNHAVHIDEDDSVQPTLKHVKGVELYIINPNTKYTGFYFKIYMHNSCGFSEVKINIDVDD